MAGVKSKLPQDITPMTAADRFLGSAPSDASAVVGYLASFAMTAFATVVAVAVDSEVTIPNLSLVFVVPVTIAGVGFGLGPSLFSAVLGALAYNFFLTEPRYTLAVNDPANIWAIGLLFLVGLIVSGVAFTCRRRATDAALLRRQATVLQGYSRDVVAADNMNAIVSITSQAVAALFQVPVVVMLVTEDKVVSVNRVRRRSPRKPNSRQRYLRWRRELSRGPNSTPLSPRALTFGRWQRRWARVPSLESHSMPANVLNHPIRWLTSLGVFGAGALSSAFRGQPRCSARTLTPREQCTPATACAAEFRIKVKAECDPSPLIADRLIDSASLSIGLY